MTGPSGPLARGPARPAGWSEAEIGTLAALAEAFVPGRAERRAWLAAAAFDLALDPSQVRQLRLVLRLLESRPANLALTGGAIRFRDLDPAARQDYLLAWGTSRLALRRSAYQAYRRLLSFLAYGDPGEPDAPNPILAAIGYVQDDPGLTADPTPIRPLELPPGGVGSGPAVLEADVAIVGSGAGGGIVARALAEAGRSVVVLEAGPLLAEPEMPRSELDGYDRLYLDHGLTATWDGSVSMLAGAAVGGGTTVNWMTCLPAPGAIRADWARSHGVDGFDGAEGDADYATISAELSLTTSTVLPPKDAVLLGGATELGLEAGPTRRDTSGCSDCGSCSFGCRAGAKQSGLRAHLAAAARASARIVPDARVERVLLDGGRAAGVEATVGWERPSARAASLGLAPVEPRRLVVRARQVVVAGGALRTPIVLERSGLGHPAIGRHLLVHPVPVVAGRFAERIEMWRGPLQAARSLAFVDGAEGRHGYTIESAPAHPGLIAQAFPWEGSAQHAALMAEVRSIAPLIAITRDGGTGRVRATRSGRARIDYRVDGVGVATMRHALLTMARILRAAGAREVFALGTPAAWFHAGTSADPAPGQAAEASAFAAFEERLHGFEFGPNRGAVFSAHQMGTARLGADPRSYACDPRGRVRQGTGSAGRDGVVAGLYVADGSLFPTGLGLNPMLTVMALARRVSRTVLAEG
jgi:choline dehydrogenase-like flavoprotein